MSSTKQKMLAAASAIVLMSAAGVIAVRAQDATPTPAPAEAAPAAAAPEPARDPDAVIAKAGSATITERELSLAQEAFASELTNVPKDQWRSVLVDAMVNMELLAQAAREAGLDKGAEFEGRLSFLTIQALRNAYVEEKVMKELTDAELQQAYQTLVVAEHKPEEQVHARHILVDTKEQAQKIIDELKGGAKFEDLAKQSKDPSGQNGGDLGFFGHGQMVPEFEKAAFSLEAGQFTQEPVQSQYGWHVIKVEEKRMSEPPTFAEVQDQLKSYVLRQKFQEVMAALHSKFPTEYMDPTAKPPEPPAAPAEAPAAPAPAPAPAP